MIFGGNRAPFGARCGAGGLGDVDNLGWKLAAVLRDYAPVAHAGRNRAGADRDGRIKP